MDYLQYNKEEHIMAIVEIVLNLVINGLPSIPNMREFIRVYYVYVLNLVINGLPSIPKECGRPNWSSNAFKF